jgi:hypothetical protein
MSIASRVTGASGPLLGPLAPGARVAAMDWSGGRGDKG